MAGNPTPTEFSEIQKHEFLIRAAELLHRYGTPSYRLEAVMHTLADRLGLDSHFLYTPTSLVIGLGAGTKEVTYIRRVESEGVDISKLNAIDETLESFEDKNLTLVQATQRLTEIEKASNPYSVMTVSIASATACAGLAVILGGNVRETIISGVMGLGFSYATAVAAGFVQRGLVEPLMGFLVAFAAVLLGQWIPINDRLVTLAVLILPIPGLSLTIALTELSLGHLSSGSARLAGAMVTLFSLVLGVAIAWRVTEAWKLPNPAIADPLPVWCLWIAVGLAPIAFAIVFKAPVTHWPTIITVVIGGFVASRLATNAAGVEAGAFIGALAVGCFSNAYARIRDRPAMIPLTPGLLILVPGSIGYTALTAMLQRDTLRGVELAFTMSIIGIALVGGVLLANQLISPKRIL